MNKRIPILISFFVLLVGGVIVSLELLQPDENEVEAASAFSPKIDVPPHITMGASPTTTTNSNKLPETSYTLDNSKPTIKEKVTNTTDKRHTTLSSVGITRSKPTIDEKTSLTSRTTATWAVPTRRGTPPPAEIDLCEAEPLKPLPEDYLDEVYPGSSQHPSYVKDLYSIFDEIRGKAKIKCNKVDRYDYVVGHTPREQTGKENPDKTVRLSEDSAGLITRSGYSYDYSLLLNGSKTNKIELIAFFEQSKHATDTELKLTSPSKKEWRFSNSDKNLPDECENLTKRGDEPPVNGYSVHRCIFDLGEVEEGLYTLNTSLISGNDGNEYYTILRFVE